MHSGFMTVEGEKMSKSLGNTHRLSDLKARGISPAALRYWFLTAKYDTQINFTWEALQEIEQKIWGYAYMITFDESSSLEVNREVVNRGLRSLQDDLHTPSVIELIDSVGGRDAKTLEGLLSLLGIYLTDHLEALQTPLPKEIIQLGQKRDEARESKDWQKSDELRDKIYDNGFKVQDMPTGTRIIRRFLL